MSRGFPVRRPLHGLPAYVLLLLLLDGLAWTPAVARAQQPDAGPRVHEGPQLRVSLGGGGLYAYQGLPGGSDEISGGSYALDFALGEMVLDRLALQLDFAIMHAPGAARGVLESTRFTALNLGVGVTYWVMPHNVYLAGALGLSSSAVQASSLHVADEEIPDIEASGVGLGLHLSAGKQWWISQRTGLGLSLSMLALSMPNDLGDQADPRRVLGASLQTTLTYR